MDPRPLFLMATCPAPPTLQLNTESSEAAKPSSRNIIALIVHHSTGVVPVSSNLPEPDASKNACIRRTGLHSFWECTPSRKYLEGPIPPHHHVILQDLTATPEPSGNYAEVIILAILILLHFLPPGVKRSVIMICALVRKRMAMIFVWARRFNPNAAHGVRAHVGVVRHTRLMQDNEDTKVWKLDPMVKEPKESHASCLGGKIVELGGGVGVVETNFIFPLEPDGPSASTRENARTSGQLAEEPKLNNLGDGDISSQHVRGERISISPCSWFESDNVNGDNFNGVYSVTVLPGLEREAPRDDRPPSSLFLNSLESHNNAITSPLPIEKNFSTAVSVFPGLACSKNEKPGSDDEEEIPQLRDIIEDEENITTNNNGNTPPRNGSRPTNAPLEIRDLVVAHADRVEYHDYGDVSTQSPVANDNVSHDETVSPPHTAGQIAPRAEDMPLPYSRGLNDQSVTGDSIENETCPAAPIGTDSLSTKSRGRKTKVTIHTPDIEDLVTLMSSWHLRSPAI